MKINIYIILLSILVSSCTKNDRSTNDVSYLIQANLHDSIPFIQVAFDYKSDDNGFIVLRYENSSCGDNDIFNCIKGIDVSPRAQNIELKADSSLITIKTKPNTISRIHYQIAQDVKGPPLNQYRYRPMIDSSYFHILGMRLFMIPEGVFESDTSKANIAITYNKNEREDLFHSSFGQDHVQHIEVTREDLYGSFWVGGDFRRYSFNYDDETIYFVTRGNWKAFTDGNILNILEEIIVSQRRFWKDPRKGDFSVSLVPTYESWYSVGGSGFSSSFMSFASNNDKVTLSQMKWLYNHELLHKWIGRTILNENEVEQYWFSEGFTDYYSYKLLLKNNSLDIDEYIDILNKNVIIPHYQDPVNGVPNDKLTFQEYWSNYAKYQKLPYRRGLLYAFFIDNEIKEQSQYSQSLDNLMKDLFSMALQDENMRLNKSLFIKNLTRYLNHTEVASDFDKYILDGELIDFKNRLPDGISIGYQDDIPVFKLNTENVTALKEKLKL